MLLAKRIEVLFDCGSSKKQEDGYFVNHPFYGVLDGASAPHSKTSPLTLFDGLTGGEMAVRTVETVFRSASTNDAPDRLILKAGRKIGRVQIERGIPSESDRLAGTTFAIAKIGKDVLEIVQAGDCFVLWKTIGGELEITKNQLAHHDWMLREEITRLMQEIARERGLNLENLDDEQRNEIREEMWIRFLPLLHEARRKHANNPLSPHGYGILNGDPRIRGLLQKFTLRSQETELVILFSDGMIPFHLIQPDQETQIAETFYRSWQKGGLDEILRVAREREEESKRGSHVDHAEATAIAIQLR